MKMSKVCVGGRYRWFPPPTLRLISWNIGHSYAITIINNGSTSFGVYLTSGTTYPKLTQNGHCLDRKAWIRPAYFLWNFGMRFYQYHPEREIKPFQWVVSQNARVGIGRLEPLGKTEEFCVMIRAQDNHPSRSDLLPLRSVSMQRRAKIPPESSRPA